MVIRTLSALFILSTLAGCESLGSQPSSAQTCPEVEPKIITKEAKPKIITKEVEVLPEAFADLKDKIIIGQAENVLVEPSGWTFKSRIDSGATTTSIDARDIKKFERDGKDWVRFNLFDRETKKTFEIEKPVTRTVDIKRHGTEIQTRYAIELKLTIGKLSEIVEVTLTDRSDFTFPVLIGRNFLIDRAVIDVSEQYIAKIPAKNK